MNRSNKKVWYLSAAAALCAALAPAPLCAESVTADDVTSVVVGWKNAKEALGEQLEAAPASVKEYPGLGGTGTYYVVTLEGGGYVVTSGDTSLEPVLAYSKTGTWVDDVKRNPLMAMVEIDIAAATAAGLAERSSAIKSGGLRLAAGGASATAGDGENAVATQNAARWARYKAAASKKGGLRLQASAPNSDLRVSPLIQSAWSQSGNGENYYTPGASTAGNPGFVCGCVATMCAQIMRYWEWPKGTNITAIANYTGTVTYGKDDAAVSTQWDLEGGYYRTKTATTKTSWTSYSWPAFGGTYDWSKMPLTFSYGTTTVQKQAIGHLTRDCGIACGMGYADGGSGASGSAFAHRAADQFAYTTGKCVSGWNDANRDTLLACLDAGIPCGVAVYGDGGHAIIADGYGYSSGTLYIHFNYGWGSTGPNDWYTPPNVGTFTSVGEIIFNVYPPSTSKYDRTIVSGRVFGNGSVQGNVTVTATNRETGFSTNVTSNSKGIYSFMLPRGYYTFSATKNGSSAKVEADVKLGVAGTGSNAKSGNIHGLDLNLGTAVTAPAVSLTHRWSFSGNLNDSVGSSTATKIGSNVNLVDGKAVCTGNGAGQGSLNLGSNLLDTDGATIEIWAANDEVKSGSRIFEYGVDIGHYFMLAWTKSTDLYVDCAEAFSDGANNIYDGTLAPFTLGRQYHIAVTFERQGDGTTKVRATRRDAASGAIQRVAVYSVTNGIHTFSSPILRLGRSFQGNADAKATYDEVRVWQGALSDAQLKASALAGPDANLSTLPWNASAVRYVAKAVWQGGATVPTASSLASSANWSCTDQNGDAITGVPDHRSVVIIPNGSTAFTIPEGFTPNWRKLQIGSEGKATAQWGKKAYTMDSAAAQLEPSASAYEVQGDANIDETVRSVAPAVQDAPAGLSGKQFRYDGWVNVSAAQSGRWAITAFADDYAAFRLDDEWLSFTVSGAARTSVVDVPKGWHRFTLIIGDWYGGYGGSGMTTDHSCAAPVTVSIDGGNNIAFTSSNFTFGAPDRAAPVVTLAGDCDWSGVGEVSLDSGAELDLNGHNLTLSGASSSCLGSTIKNTSATQSRITLANGGKIDSANISLVGDIGFGGATLVHRWSFNGTTDAENLTDSVGGAVAKKMYKSSNTTTVEGGTVNWSDGKAVLLGGGGKGHLNFGAGILGTGNAATLEIWVKRTVEVNAWAYLVNYGIIDSSTANHLSLSVAKGSGDASRWGVTENRVDGNDKGGKNMFSPPVGAPYYVSLTLRDNGDGSTAARWTIRDGVTGFIYSEQSVTVTSWTLTSAAANGWALTLGNNPWTNSTLDLGCEIDEVRIWNGALGEEQIHANVLAGPNAALGGGESSIIIEPGVTFTVPTAGGYGYKTDSTVSLGVGAKIRFDTTGCFGKGLRFRTGGFILPSGSALDFVELSDSESYVATMENANTILVQLKSTIPYESTWNGGTPSSASDFVNPANWTSVNAAGATISAAPTNTTTVILPAAALATFTLPSGFTPNWGRVILGGHTATQCGRIASAPNPKATTYRDAAIGSYTSLGALGFDAINGGSTSWQTTNLKLAQVRFDGWFYVSAAQSGKWDMRIDFDDTSTFALDGEWVFTNPKWEPNDLTAGCFVSEGWHRFTFIGGDTGGGYGSEITVNNVKVPFSISINGGSAVAFYNAFTFGSDTDMVTLAGDTDWRALGVLDVTGGVTIDLNGHNLAVADITRSSLGASIVDGSATGSSLYVNGLPSESLAQASGMVSVPIVQYGQKSAVWTGAENDGGNALTPGNWAVRNGAGMTVVGIPDNETAVAVSGENVNLQIPSGSAFRCQSLAIGNCTLTADCDWRGLAVTPTITGTADLNGHDLRLSHLVANAGSALANSGDGVSGVVFDATTGNYNETSYVDGLSNLGTSENAHIVILRSEDDSMSSLNVGNTANVWTEVRVTGGSFSSSANPSVVGNASSVNGILTVNGGNVTLNSLKAQVAGNGTVNLKSGTLTVTGWTDYGNTSSGMATFNQSGGTFESRGNFWFGRDGSGTATYNMTGGNLNFTAGSFHLGQTVNTKGIFNQSGGDVEMKCVAELGADGGSAGTYNMTGGRWVTTKYISLGHRSGRGTMNVSNGVVRCADTIHVGYKNTGTLNIYNGGDVTSLPTLAVGSAGGTGTLNVYEGGKLVTPQLRRGSSTANVMFAGGTIVATNAVSPFFSNLTDITLGKGGMTVDSAGQDIAITAGTFTTTPGSMLRKVGAGKFTMHTLPSVDKVKVEGGTLALSADADNSVPVPVLAHRWSFTGGSLADSAGNSTAVQVGLASFADNAVTFPGGGNGSCYLNLGNDVIPSTGDVTIELWGRRNEATHQWASMFSIGVNTNNNNSLRMAWSNHIAGDGSTDMVYLKKNGSNIFFESNTMTPYTVGTMYHISMRIEQNADGSAKFTWSKRNASTGAIEKTYTANVSSDKGWSLADYAGNPFVLNHGYDNDDEAATYDEVRIWNGALDDEALTLSARKGADATAEVLAEVAAASRSERVLELAGGTLDLGGHTLRQPVVKGNGGTVTTGAGELDVTDSLVVNLADCIAGNCIRASGTIDFTGAKLVIEDPEVLETHQGSIWLVRAAQGGSITFVGTPECVPELPKGWRLSLTARGAKLTRGSFVIQLR